MRDLLRLSAEKSVEHRTNKCLECFLLLVLRLAVRRMAVVARPAAMGMSVKALKRALKKAGLKTTGKKAALTKRAKKAHLMRGGAVEEVDENGTTKYKSTNTGMVYDTRAEAERMDTPPSTATSAGRRRRRNGRSRRGGYDY